MESQLLKHIEDGDGGPAFPFSTIDGLVIFGMTLRDYFAAQALQGLLSSHGLSFDPTFINKFSKLSYDFADGMLRAREEL